MKHVGYLILFGAATVIAFGAPRPDLSGKWSLNLDASDFGPAPRPDHLDYTIEQQAAALRIDWEWASSQGDMSGTATYETDGAENHNRFGELELASTACWEGETLKIRSWGELFGSAAEFQDSWTVESSSRLRVTRIMTSSMGELKQVLVFDKVPTDAPGN